ncbi:MAG: class I SAM-dependent methyltransferase [Pseudomonadales bacterium]|jgi:ubiquinone/menaquinone biosynthesis C-methylase UbiE|nr:class I SAM-dependent methyltransferase [Pseudomonadales bacterium]
MSGNELQTSHKEYRKRYFDTEEVSKYAQRLMNSKTHVREIKCISKALTDTAKGAHVLDIPCGAGRLIPDLVGLGYRVTAADVAPLMLMEAQKYAESRQVKANVDYAVADVLDTGFEDNSFDVVICNRMFHHFREPEVRVTGLRELKRIAREYLIVSFFCNLSSDAMFFHIGNYLRKNKSTDRLPIHFSQMKRDAIDAGLQVVGIHPMRPAISRQWYLKLMPTNEVLGVQDGHI